MMGLSRSSMYRILKAEAYAATRRRAEIRRRAERYRAGLKNAGWVHAMPCEDDADDEDDPDDD